MKSRPKGGFVIQTLLPPGAQQNPLHPFGGVMTRQKNYSTVTDFARFRG
jgi:hypothetical protein